MSNTSQKIVLFLLPFGKGMGVGHAVRQGVLAGELRTRGYETILWTTGAFDEIPPALVGEMKECFSQIIRPSSVVDDSSKFPDVAAVEALKNIKEINDLKAVVVDDYRLTGKPWRLATLQALRSFAHGKGARVIMVDGVRGLEFDQADVIWNMELGRDESLYKPEWKKKMIYGLQYALLREAFLQPQAVDDKIPENAFLLMIGGTDPRNSTQSILEGMVSTGYNPILVLNKSDKPEDTARMQRLKDILGKFPQSLWLANQQAPQMSYLYQSVKFAIVGPGSSPCAEAFYHRCPLIGAWTNPSLEANVTTLEKMGLPTLRATNHDAFMASWEDKNSTLEGTFASADVEAAVDKLEALGYVTNRLPNISPFNQVNARGAVRIADAFNL